MVRLFDRVYKRHTDTQFEPKLKDDCGECHMHTVGEGNVFLTICVGLHRCYGMSGVPKSRNCSLRPYIIGGNHVLRPMVRDPIAL